MKQIYQVLTGCLLSVASLCFPTTAQAQQENNVWYFGNQAGLRFSSSAAPTPLTDGQLNSVESCASVATAAGNLAVYSDGVRAWDANHQLMPNATNLGGHVSGSQSVLILPQPGSTTRYYLFTVDAIENNLVAGLRYSVIDMTLRGGLGDVVPTEKTIRLPTPTVNDKVTEKLTAALHDNGRDYWVVVHGWQSDTFYSFLLSPAGVSAIPVASSVGTVHAGGGSFFGSANAVGQMRISPLGTHLALALRDSHFELYDFDKATGRVSNYVRLEGANDRHYGIEFSPDNSLLYVGMYQMDGYNSNVYQFNLRAGSPAAIQSSRQTVMGVSGLAQGLRLGPDGKIYIGVLNQPYLHTISQPNALGTACGFTFNAVVLTPRISLSCLPNTPNVYARTALATHNPLDLSHQLQVYPNPAHSQGHVAVQVPASLQTAPLQVAIVNSVGQTVKQLRLKSQGAAGVSVDVQSLTPGVYTLRVTGQVGTACKPLVLQ